MTGQLFNSSSPTQEQDPNQGRSIADILALPPRQRRLINYIRRNKKCTIDELLNNFEDTQMVIESDLNILIKEGFLIIDIIEGNRYYSFEFGQKKGIQIEGASSALVPGKPISYIVNPSGNYALEAGEDFILRVSVINQGGKSALIYVKIDDNCELVQAISEYIDSQSVALNPGQSYELVFTIPIPPDTIIGNYNYRLEIDAPHHYPEETPISHEAQLQIRPYIAETQQKSDPFFVVKPNTSSTNPLIIDGGDSILVELEVYNSSDQVDRFRLSCKDLPSEWYKIIYPEGANIPGLVINTDGLELNPGENNVIELIITPPIDAIAKIYAPTLRIYSENKLLSSELETEDSKPILKSELVMLDLFYFQVKPLYQLEIEMNTRRGLIKNPSDIGEYELRLANKGNTPRKLKLKVDPGNTEKNCNCILTTEELTLNPNTHTRIRLDIHPKEQWKRQFYPNTLNFAVEITDLEALEIPNDRFDGVLVVEGRPWWTFLLLMLGILGTIGVFIFLIWLFFFRPKPLPKVVSFNPQSIVYRELNNDVIRLNWEITQPKRIKNITLNGFYKDGSPIAQPVIYDFTEGIPEALKDQCTLKKVLNCNGIITNARKSAEYTFELTIVTNGKKEEIITAKTNPVQIDGIPVPEVLSFFSTQPIYQEVLPSQISSSVEEEDNQINQGLQGQILLNWAVNFSEQLQGLILTGKDKEGVVVLPPISFIIQSKQDTETLKINSELCAITSNNQLDCKPNLCQVQNEVLSCRTVPTGIKQPGEYTFELTPIPKKKLEKPLPPKITDLIKIIPVPIKILSFSIEGTEAVLPKYTLGINPNEPPVLTLGWKVEGGADLKVELTPSPGTVIREGQIPYPLSPTASTETITLTASNSAGDKVIRSFILETILPPEQTLVPNQQVPPNAAQQVPPSATQQVPPTGQIPPTGQNPQTPPTNNPNTPTEQPSEPTTPPTPSVPQPPGGTPPVPGDRNSPPPAELPPTL